MDYTDILNHIQNAEGKRTEAENVLVAAILAQTSCLLLNNVKKIRKALGDGGGRLTIPLKVTINEEEDRIRTSTAGKVEGWNDNVQSTIPDGKQGDFKFQTVID